MKKYVRQMAVIVIKTVALGFLVFIPKNEKEKILK